MKILVIDDDREGRYALAEVLRSEGYEVIVAEEGEEGLRVVRSEHPSLVITDILMPEMDGFRLLREIRKDASLKNLPVIFYTGTYIDNKDRELAREIGASEFLIKPVAPSEIVKTVKELLESREKGGPSVQPPPSIEEPVFLKLYNERLVNKLKSKIVESERSRIYIEHIMESIADGVIVIDRDYRIVQANSAAAASLGKEKSDMAGRTCYDVIHQRRSPCEPPDVICPLVQIFERTAKIVNVLHTHLDAAGNERYIEITASPMRDGSGEVFAMVETYRDLMDKKAEDELVKLVKRLNEAQTHLKHMTITDELTGLRNRRYIVERLEEEYQHAKRSGQPLSLIMLDIDHFKDINDVHGHLFGDVVLRVVSLRIRDSLRKHDVVGRVGGEEFLILSPDSDRNDSLIVAERIRKIVHDEPISDGAREARVALSAGVAVLDESDTSADSLFSRADTALYKAKQEGRNRVVAL